MADERDDGLAVVVRGRGLRVTCAACGALLLVTESRDGETVRSLALHSLERVPCCDRWRHDG